LDVRFTPKRGHMRAYLGMSALCHNWKSPQDQPRLEHPARISSTAHVGEEIYRVADWTPEEGAPIPAT
jgi:hypothetical protein